jgi:hypothetical protein
LTNAVKQKKPPKLLASGVGVVKQKQWLHQPPGGPILHAKAISGLLWADRNRCG